MFTLNKVISGIAESLDAIGLGQEQIDLIESSFNREITFAQESVKILPKPEKKPAENLLILFIFQYHQTFLQNMNL